MKTIFFIHGFTAKDEDNSYLLEYLKKRNRRVYTFKLPGHEEDRTRRSTKEEYIKKSEEEFVKVLEKHKKVILIGHSMGGAIASILAAQYPVKKLILIAPAFEVGSIEQNAKDLKNLITHKNDPKLETGFEGVLKKVFTTFPTNYLEVRKVGNMATKELEHIKCPTLIVHGNIDQVVDQKTSKKAFEKIKAPKTYTVFKNVRHQVFKGYRKKEIAKYVNAFIIGGLYFKLVRKEEL